MVRITTVLIIGCSLMRDAIEADHDVEMFASVIRASQMPMAIADARKPDTPIVFVNDAFERLTGYPRAEIIGQNCRLLQGPDTDRAAVSRIRAALAAGTEIQIDILNYRKDGSQFWNALYINPTRDESGAVRFFFALQINVSDRIEAQRAITEQKAIVDWQNSENTSALALLTQAKSVADNAVRQKADFVANMSHELRTPLTGILGLHDLLQSDPTLGVAQRRYLIMARDAGRALLAIVNDVLDFSKIEAGELVIEKLPFSLLPLVEACEDLMAEAARAKSLRFDVSVPDSSLTLLGDAARLKQILLNLLTNAVKFTEQGVVSLNARYNAETKRLRFEITDTGIGISAKQLPMMFKRFSQADASITRRYGGTGLGLAICQRLTELMGGEVGVTSTPGQGSTFWVEVPAQQTSGELNELENPWFGHIVPRRILLAEDNLVNQEIIKAMLETRGHDVTIVDNGAAAAATARSTPAFDIILMDLQMPIMDGLSAARVIRVTEKAEGRNATPIVGLTANVMVEDIKRCLEAGMDGHIAKPIDWSDFYDEMDRVTDRRSVAPSARLEATKTAA